MISGLLVVLVVIGLMSSALLARGGKAGPETANPYWFLLSGANILLALHVLGLLLPETAFVPWTAVVFAFAGFAAAGLRELSLWTHDLLPRPGNREFIMEFTAALVHETKFYRGTQLHGAGVLGFHAGHNLRMHLLPGREASALRMELST